jgi:glycerate 2-kinase
MLDKRNAARELFDHALKSVDARHATRNAALTTLKLADRPLFVIALGKAAPAMAAGIDEVLRANIAAAVLSGPALTTSLPHPWSIFHGGHPLPNEQSLAAAHASLQLLKRADTERGLVVYLVSGGGSAMMEWPRSPEITLADIREANRQLVTCGATIAEVNSVRRAFSAIKGGGLPRLAPRAEHLTLIVSDTNSGDEANVASGPTLAPPAGEFHVPAPQIIARHKLDSSLPQSILNAVGSYAPEATPDRSHPHYVLLDNHTALAAAAARARELGFVTRVTGEINEQPIAEGCELLWREFAQLAGSVAGQPVCLISGGEFSCPVRGDGLGGRNSETALRIAVTARDAPFDWVFLSAGTDGLDGNSPAAGALADSSTLGRAARSGVNPEKFLERSDAYSLFEKLGDAIVTGPTGTNVRDLRIMMTLVNSS